MIRRPPRSTPFPTRRSSDLFGCGSPQPFEERVGVHAPIILRPAFDAAVVPRADAIQPRRVSNRQRAKHEDRKSTRLNSSHLVISYAVFCLKKKKKNTERLKN